MKIGLTKQPGYTLLELMVSVLIFSGIIVLAIAAFARSANSSLKSNTVRNQVQAARAVIDQLTNDLHYIDMTDQATSFHSSCGANATQFIGVRLSPNLSCDEAELLIKYPGATGTNDLVWRLYAAQTLNSRPSVYVYELRGCSVASKIISCPGVVGTPSDLLSSGYVADGLGGSTPVFSGADVLTANNSLVSPYVQIKFNLKPAANLAQTCSVLAPGACYTLNTTVIPGSI